MSRLSIVDYAFLVAESPESPMNVGVLQIFQIPEGKRRGFVRGLVEAMRDSDVGPPFNRKLKNPPLGLGLPTWVRDDNLDLEYHVRHSALPRPGGTAELMDLVSRLHPRLMDRSRPLWECHVIEGLRGGRFALYGKMHHACVDGVRGMQLIEAGLAHSPDEPMTGGFWNATLTKRRKRRPVPSLGDRLASTTELLGAHLKGVPDIYRNLFNMGMQSMGLRSGRVPVPFTAPATPLDGPLTQSRRCGIQSLPFQEVKALSKATGTTINEVVLAVCAGALRQYLDEHNALPDEALIATIPMAIKREDGKKSGNQITFLQVGLATDVDDPMERLEAIHDSSTEAKNEALAMSPEAVVDMALLVNGGAMLAHKVGLGRLMPQVTNLIISNVPGPREQLYLDGAPLQASYPLSALNEGFAALNITVLSTGEGLDFGLTACREAVPDVNQLADHLGTAFRALQKAAESSSEKAAAPRRRRRRLKGGMATGTDESAD